MVDGRTMRVGRVVVPGLVAVAMLVTTGCHRDPTKQKLKYLESGKRYEADGKYKEAAIQFSNALKVDRNFAEAHYELGQTYLKMGSVLPGYSELSRAVALKPNDIKARVDLGTLLLAGHEPDRAKEQAQAILSFDANNADAHALLSSVAASKGDRDEALAQIKEALARDPNRAQFHTALGILESSENAAGGPAEQELQQAVKLDPKNAVSHLALASVLERRGDKSGALAEYQAAVAADPKNLIARINLAQFFQRQKDSAQEEATLVKAAGDLSDTAAGADVLQSYYLQSGQIQKGAQTYGQLVSEHPKSVYLRLAYARFLLATKDVAKARSVAEDLNKTDGSDPDVAVLNAAILLTDNKTNDAFDLLQKAVKNNPDNVPAKLWLGRAALRKGDFNTAQSSYSAALQLSPGNAEARDGMAQVAMAKHDSGLLTQVADGAIKAAPQNPVGYLWRGMSEADSAPDRAQADFQQALKLDPKNWAAAMELGALKMSEKKVAEARPLLQQALDGNPNSDRALGLLVSTYLADKQLPKAISLVQTQIGKSPQNSTMYIQLSELLMQNGDSKGSADAAEKAVQLAPNNPLAVMAAARADVAQGNPARGVGLWQTYLKGKPDDANGWAVLGSLQQSSGDNQGAEASYKKALSLQPDQPIAANNLAYLMVENGGNTDVALSYAQAARRALPNAPTTADTLAWVYYAKGTYSSARDLLEQAAEQDPKSAAIQYHLGMTLKKLSDAANAELHLRKAISLDPNSDAAKNAQKALGQAT